MGNRKRCRCWKARSQEGRCQTRWRISKGCRRGLVAGMKEKSQRGKDEGRMNEKEKGP